MAEDLSVVRLRDFIDSFLRDALIADLERDLQRMIEGEAPSVFTADRSGLLVPPKDARAPRAVRPEAKLI